MAKNNWINGDTFTRTSVNQPFWLASGTYQAGSDRIELQVSPGAIRYPWKPAVMYSGQAQQLLINNPQAAKYYSVFVRSDGSMMVSGTTALTPVPAPPRYDAEPLGIVFTGASLGTANMVGPWNQGAFGTYEQRGQISSSLPPRMVYRHYVNYWGADTNLFIGRVTTNVSGIASIKLTDANTDSRATILSATIRWVPSGAPGAGGTVNIIPTFWVVGGEGASVLPHQALHPVTATYALSPVSAVEERNTSFTAIAPSGTYGGFYSLMAQTATGAIIIRGVTFIAQPGYYGSNTTEL